MSVEEKQGAIKAWDKHAEGTAHKHKFMSFSGVADEIFCETFKMSVMARGSLTQEEKQEILIYMKQPRPVV